MKSLIAMISLLAVGAAWAQAPKPAAAEPAKPEAQAPAKPAVQAQASATPQAASKASRKPNPKRSEDARHCLEKSSSTEVIKCAEEYL